MLNNFSHMAVCVTIFNKPTGGKCTVGSIGPNWRSSARPVCLDNAPTTLSDSLLPFFLRAVFVALTGLILWPRQDYSQTVRQMFVWNKGIKRGLFVLFPTKTCLLRYFATFFLLVVLLSDRQNVFKKNH